MDYFDKKINELYNQPEQDVPEGLSWDNMEDGIYSRMDNKKSKRKVLWYWIGGSMIAIALIIVSSMAINSEEQKTIFATQNIDNNKIGTSKSTESSQEKTVSNLENNSEKRSTPNREKTIAATKETIASNQNISLKEVDEKSISQPNKNLSTTTENLFTKSSKDHFNSLEENTIHNREIFSSIIIHEDVSETIVSVQKNKILLDFDKISSVAPKKLNSQREKIISTHQKLQPDNNLLEVDSKRNTNYTISLLGGTSLHSGYNIQNNNYTTSLPGYSVRLGLSIEKENNWGCDFGVGHSLLVEKFDFDKTDTISVLQDNIVVSHLTNSLSGNTIEVIGEAYRDSTRNRRELIYNTINLLSIDASIYRSINISNKWSIAPSLGVQFDRLLNIEGKSLDTAKEVFAYNNNTLDINKNLLSANLGIGIDYRMTNSLALSLRASTTLSVNDLYNGSKGLMANYIRGGIKIKL